MMRGRRLTPRRRGPIPATSKVGHLPSGRATVEPPVSEDLYDQWSWRAVSTWAWLNPGIDTLLILFATFGLGLGWVLSGGRPLSLLVFLVVGVLWHTWRVLWVAVAGSPWRSGRLVLLCSLGGLCLSLYFPSVPALVFLGRTLVLTMVLLTACYPIIGFWRRLRYHMTHEGTVAVMTAVLAVIVAWGSWSLFQPTLQTTRNLVPEGGLVAFTDNPDAHVTLTVTPATSLSGNIIPDKLDVTVDTDGTWLLVTSGRWAGDVHVRVEGEGGGIMSPPSPLPIETNDDINQLVLEQSSLLSTPLNPQWLANGDVEQYQGVGRQVLRFTLKQPYLHDDHGHRAVVYGSAGCAYNLPWTLAVARGNPSDTAIANWYVPATCLVAESPIRYLDDFVESYTRNPTVYPNQAGWVTRSDTESPEEITSRFTTMLEAATTHNPDGTITSPLFLTDEERIPGGTRDPSAITMPAQLWKAQSDSVVSGTSTSQALAITGFGAAGALAVTVLVAALRLKLGETTWKMDRYVPPGMDNGKRPRGSQATFRGRDSGDTHAADRRSGHGARRSRRAAQSRSGHRGGRSARRRHGRDSNGAGA